MSVRPTTWERRSGRMGRWSRSRLAGVDTGRQYGFLYAEPGRLGKDYFPEDNQARCSTLYFDDALRMRGQWRPQQLCRIVDGDCGRLPGTRTSGERRPQRTDAPGQYGGVHACRRNCGTHGAGGCCWARDRKQQRGRRGSSRIQDGIRWKAGRPRRGRHVRHSALPRLSQNECGLGRVPTASHSVAARWSILSVATIWSIALACQRWIALWSALTRRARRRQLNR